MHCPSLNIFGTFFPSWMLCTLLGIVAAALSYRLLRTLRFESEVSPPLVFYPSIFVSVSAALWLIFYGN